MPIAAPRTHTVEAYNLSHASENKIHDDTVAKKLGFSGGLVPGVEVYAYMTHLAVAKWGRAFLERGEIDCRFLKPVYDGRMATVTATDAPGGAIALEVVSEGVQCATGQASLPAAAATPPAIAAYTWNRPPALAARPPADEASLATTLWLSTTPTPAMADVAAAYLRDVREKLPLYASEGLLHPGQILRLCNLVLRENVVMAPWIHTGSKVRCFSPARVGETLEARARIAANYDKKGHRLVDLDTLIIANGDRVVAHVLHTAVYKLRHLAAA